MYLIIERNILSVLTFKCESNITGSAFWAILVSNDIANHLIPE